MQPQHNAEETEDAASPTPSSDSRAHEDHVRLPPALEAASADRSSARERKAAAAPFHERARIAVSLLSSFDFDGTGVISHSNWLQGTALLALPDPDSGMWRRLSTQFGDGSSQAEDTAEIDLANLPEHTPHPALMSHVLRGLIGSLASMSTAVGELQAQSLVKRVERLERSGVEQAAEIVALKARAAQQREVRKGRLLTSAWRSAVFMPFDSWANLAASQRATRRAASMRALAPGYTRCFLRWQRQAARQAAAATIPQRTLQLRLVMCRRETVRALASWVEATRTRRRHTKCSRCGRELLLGMCFHRWVSSVGDGAAATDESRRPKSAPSKPRSKRPTSPGAGYVRGLATGWHQDLAMYGTGLSHREETRLQAQHAKQSAHLKVQALEARLAYAEARAAVLERRHMLRERLLASPTIDAAIAASIFERGGGGVGMAGGAADGFAIGLATGGYATEGPPQVAATAGSGFAAAAQHRPSPRSSPRPSPPPGTLSRSRPRQAQTTISSSATIGGTARPLSASIGGGPAYQVLAAPHRAAPPLLRVDLTRMHGLLAVDSRGAAAQAPRPGASSTRHTC